MDESRINFKLSKKLHARYKVACEKLQTKMRYPLINAINRTIKDAAGRTS